MKAEDLKKEIEEDYKKWKKFMEATKSDEQKGYEIDRKIMFNNGFLAGQEQAKAETLKKVFEEIEQLRFFLLNYNKDMRNYENRKEIDIKLIKILSKIQPEELTQKLKKDLEMTE